ncbi:flippase [Halobacterium hubeiense]|uniref:flippase n=1 Tax=Halobacterium hubeiense TaxID=1407499 RepID=UPI003C717D34
MRHGHTSIVNFVSRLIRSAAGFLATIVLTRTLGQERYGTYVLVLSVVAWVTIVADPGLTKAVQKRVSETSPGNYVAAGALSLFGLLVAVSVALWLGEPFLTGYLGMEATIILVVVLGSNLIGTFVRTVLIGQHRVHVASLTEPLEWGIRSGVQVALVLTGFGLAGAFAGYFIGSVVAAAIGLYFVNIDLARPTREEFQNLRSFAQFSWLDSIRGQAFLSMDTVILGYFVANSVIAVYAVSWNLATLFATFGASIAVTLFPEMSKISSEGEVEEVGNLLEVSLAYAGLFTIPGLLGGAIIGDRVLAIYGSGFSTGYAILLVLTFARLLYGYQSQFVNTLNAIDRPDLTFRLNSVFITTNLVLNLALTPIYGWYGAAVATTISTTIGLVLGFRYASSVVDLSLPILEVAKQVVAAGVMAGVVGVGRLLFGESIPLIVALVAVGGFVYFAVFTAISQQFRTTVRDNLPEKIPF